MTYPNVRGARATRTTVLLLATVLLSAAAARAEPDPSSPGRWSIGRPAAPVPALAPEGSPAGSPDVELILDDGSWEADVGFSDVAAMQFLWLNRFEGPPDDAVDLTEIQVLFPPGPDVVPGSAIQLVVYHDPDSDPTNGAELLAAIDETIQLADGTTFSVYPLDPPVSVRGPGDVLIGVVNRFVESGVSPPSRPAALDTTSTAGRSWVALWTGDPPPVPELPPDSLISTIDFLEPGNWMIRARGTVPVLAIPTLGRFGTVLLVALLALGGTALLRRSRRAPRWSARLPRASCNER